MGRSQALSVPPAAYNGFLFAQVYEEADGIHLSVLSALVRMNIDPWQEATRLTAMPKARAVENMKSVLALISGKSWQESEVTETAERLIDLLPHGSTPLVESGVRTPVQVSANWLVWAGLGVLVSLITTHLQAQDGGKAASPTTIASPRSGSAPFVKPITAPASKPNDVVPSVPLSR